MHVSPGQLGKYELLERLGQGGMAEVWKAFDVRLQRHVAIKFLHSMLRSDPAFLTRFVREAQAVASLHHPNIVQIYDFETPEPGEGDSLAYMVMDYVEGQTLADYLRETSHARKFLPASDLVSLFFSLSDAIDYAHRRGLLHRDIKPANVLLDQRNTARNPMGEPILTDFGIVKIMGSAAGTLTGSSIGTPLYISPEQARGHPDSAASDIYSLGVVLYEACTGTVPFSGETPFAILQQHITTPPPPPEQFNPAITPAQSAVLQRCLAKEPEERFPTAMALMTALAESLGVELPERRGQPISSPDIRSLPASSAEVEDLPTRLLEASEPLTPVPPSVVNPVSPVPELAPTLVDTPARPLSPVAESQTGQDTAPPVGLAAPAPRPVNRRRGWIIALAALLVIVLGSSGLLAYRALHSGSGTPNTAATASVVGQAFFLSSGAASGANNLGINDEFQVRLTNIPAPAAGKQYFAWLLPDKVQTEASPRALGALTVSGGVATLPALYIDPQHINLVGQFSRFLVTEEAASPVPTSYSLDKTTWRYTAEIPQNSPMPNCQGNTNQLSVLCHMRHLLSGDPELARVHLQGGLNFWFHNNVQEMVKWAQEAKDHQNPVDVRHKLVDILYILGGPACIAQSLHNAAPGLDNTVDDHTLPTIAAIPLMDCSLTPNVYGYVTHIHNHLNAMLQSPGILKSQTDMAVQIGSELNMTNEWLQGVESDAMKLIAMDNTQLTQAQGVSLRNELNGLATNVLSGGTDPNTNKLVKGVQDISGQIQQLATMNVGPYKA